MKLLHIIHMVDLIYGRGMTDLIRYFNCRYNVMTWLQVTFKQAYYANKIK
jgi:hypothetical protein